MRPAYYNENDPAIVGWLRELIRAGVVAFGEVDDRSIVDVEPRDLAGFGQCHFFAGIGGWSYALRLAGWSDERPVWTGSCPCQPFSKAGAQQEFDDARHLWPHWFELIRESKPVVIVGEQVSAKNGRAWVDVVRTDLEGCSYAVGILDTNSASVGAPNLRQRLYWLAESDRGGCAQQPAPWLHADRPRGDDAAGRGVDGGMGHASGARLQGLAGDGDDRHESGRLDAWPSRPVAAASVPSSDVDGGRGAVNGFWRPADWLRCSDGLWRPIEPRTVPLVTGVPGRLVRLRGYGNAINVEVGRAFVEAYLDVLADRETATAVPR